MPSPFIFHCGSNPKCLLLRCLRGAAIKNRFAGTAVACLTAVRQLFDQASKDRTPFRRIGGANHGRVGIPPSRGSGRHRSVGRLARESRRGGDTADLTALGPRRVAATRFRCERARPMGYDPRGFPLGREATRGGLRHHRRRQRVASDGAEAARSAAGAAEGAAGRATQESPSARMDQRSGGELSVRPRRQCDAGHRDGWWHPQAPRGAGSRSWSRFHQGSQ